jgi:sugar phosphate isomerase/epimerase
MATMISRRELMGAALASPLLTAAAKSAYKGVPLGAQTYSFRDRDLDGCLKAMQEIGMTYAEVFTGHVEPKMPGTGKEQREAIRKWRLGVTEADIKPIVAKFKAAGVTPYAYNYSFRDDFTDDEMDKGFLVAKWLGAKSITASATVSVAKRVAPFAAKHKMRVGMHNHSRIHENEFATPESFAEAMKAGEYIAVNLDLGHFWAANFDPVDYLKKNHEKIVTVHLKDRKKNQGANMPFGEGDTPLKECLHLIRDSKWKIPAMIEYEYKGADTVVEVRKCFEYSKKLLLA